MIPRRPTPPRCDPRPPFIRRGLSCFDPPPFIVSGSIGMLVKTGLVLSFVLASTISVWAQGESCGNPPFAPAIPSPADLKAKSATDAHSAVHDAFMDVKNGQG